MAVESGAVTALTVRWLAAALTAIVAAAGAPVLAQPAASSGPTRPSAASSAIQGSAPIATPSTLPASLQTLLQQIKQADTDLLAVSEEDGQFLRLMVTTGRATRALEVGGANGYSAIWIGLGLRQTGGRLTTIEYDPARARSLAENIRKAGLSDIVTVVSGDAFTVIPTLTGPFDFVFLDAWKRDYKRFFDLLLPRLVPRGLFLAHNVVNKRSEMPDFLDAIRRNPDVMTSIVAPSGEGMSVTLKLK